MSLYLLKLWMDQVDTLHVGRHIGLKFYAVLRQKYLGQAHNYACLMGENIMYLTAADMDMVVLKTNRQRQSL